MVKIREVCSLECTDGISDNENRVLKLFGAVRRKLLYRADRPPISDVSE